MKYNFDKEINRSDTNSVKHDLKKELFGSNEVMPMWVADMDFETPDFIVESIVERAKHPVYGYTYKNEALFQSIIQWFEKRHQWHIEKRWLGFSPGIVPALHFAVLAYTNPGEKVIVQPPVYYPFFNAIEDQGRFVLNNPLKFDDNRYTMDYDQLLQIIDKDTRLLLLCNPHNPCGRVWEKWELEKLAEICLKHEIIVISDEIHCDLVYPNYKHIPLASIDKNIARHTVTFVAPSKTFNLAGLSTSVIISSNQQLLNDINVYLGKTHLDFGNIFGTIAMEVAYRKGEEWLNELLHYLIGNINIMKRYFSRVSHISMIKPEATYLAWLDCRALKLTDGQLKKVFIEKVQLGLNDGPMFGIGGNGFQRLNFACPRKTVVKAMSRIEKYLENV